MEIKKVILSVGARPNFMKAAPIWEKLKENLRINPVLVHTGQHYDREMSDSFIQDLGLPHPDIHLGVGSGTHAQQTGKVMTAFEKVCLQEKPDLVMVVGDVNSTLACALVAAKLWIPVAHVEAGLRSFDRSMPEEINRILTDQISDYLFTTCEEANHNLKKEGIPDEKIHFVGNVMIDSLLKFKKAAQESRILEDLGFKEEKKYALVTLHRPSNVDDLPTFRNIMGALKDISSRLPVVFPAHPRTLNQIQKLGASWEEFFYFKEKYGIPQKNSSLIDDKENAGKKHATTKKQAPPHNLFILKPVGYVDFLSLMSQAAVVLTDSGGIQEETTILKIPCLTLRENTERPVTIREGTNRLVGNDPDRIKNAVDSVLCQGVSLKNPPRYWDGKTAQRITKIIQKSKIKIQKG